MTSSQADIPTEWGSRYLGQLCAHFAHKPELEVTQEENSGVICFPAGQCSLTATPHQLRLLLDCRDQSSLEKLQDVIDKHLQRFAFREPPAIDWRPA